MFRRPSSATLIASVALFFSLTGAGFAASHYLITSLSQIKPSVRVALRGARGLQGPAGSQGSAGVQGPQGPAGPQGQPGTSFDYADEYQVTDSSPIVLHNAGTDNAYTSGGDAVAQCHGNDVAISGGFYVENASIVLSSPVQPQNGPAHAWQAVGYQSPANTDSATGVTAFADCVPLN